MTQPAAHPVQNMPAAQPSTKDGPTSRSPHRQPGLGCLNRNINLGAALLASVVATTSVASDIHSLESITFTHFDITRFDWQTPYGASASASYDGQGPFNGVSASPSVESPPNCGMRCDSASASVSEGMVGAYLNEWADACGAGASASIVYRIPGASGALLTILSVHGAQENVSIRLANGSWQCPDCLSGAGTFEVPPGSDLIIATNTFDGWNGIVGFVLQPVAPDEPAPFVVGAFASASSCCIVDEIVEVEDEWTETDWPRMIPCGWEYGACGKQGCAIFSQADPDPEAMTWRSSIEFEGSSTGWGCASATSRSVARLEVVAPLTLETLELPGGRLAIDGVQRVPSDFPVTLAPGVHTMDFATLDSHDSSRIALTVTTDPDAFADCNSNGEPDGCEIVSTDLADIDRNWLPDTCQRAFGDLNLDGLVDAVDMATLLAAWGSASSPADLNGDGSVNAADISVLLGNWGEIG